MSDWDSKIFKSFFYDFKIRGVWLERCCKVGMFLVFWIRSSISQNYVFWNYMEDFLQPEVNAYKCFTYEKKKLFLDAEVKNFFDSTNFNNGFHDMLCICNLTYKVSTIFSTYSCDHTVNILWYMPGKWSFVRIFFTMRLIKRRISYRFDSIIM